VFRDLTAEFFRSRGKNLLLAGFSFLAVFGLLRLLRWYVLRVPSIRSRFRRSFTIRLLDIVYYVFCVLGSTAALFLVLYASGDWVLLGLAILFLAGLAWASKTVIPGFYEQAKLLLNLGPVREGERVVLNGVPWEVQTINVYTELTNPAFEGARLRLPLRALLALNSRPTEDSVPWFPCRRNDWVRLSDGTRGKVVDLTPEWVRLVMLGGSRKTFTIAAFLDLHPENLSHNFRVRVRFGIDYAHQAEATTTIPALMQKAVESGLLEMIERDDLKNLSVDFCEAGPSSLDYAVLADFSGNVAARAEHLERSIHRFLVDAANEHHWVIPFQQVTIHQGVSGLKTGGGSQ
jgi:small-conductance mechanosensitive channel